MERIEAVWQRLNEGGIVLFVWDKETEMTYGQMENRYLGS